METLEKLIKSEIKTKGPMDVATFMGLALGHPKHGYYMTRDPLGAQGDFTTSPEICQLFGEMISVCIIEAWMRAGKHDVHLVELGPGRGTLMADILRTAKNAQVFLERITVHLVETSPTLRKAQAEKIKPHTAIWHNSVDTLPTDAPLLIIANEFFDALPIRQAIMTPRGWQERGIGMEGDKLVFTSIPTRHTLPPKQLGAIMEFSPARDAVMTTIAKRLQKQGGMLLALDYGHDIPNAVGDTFQAVRKHQYTSPLENIGESDLTSHVDFAKLAQIAQAEGCNIFGPVTQKYYLETMGIQTRLNNLIAHDPKNGFLANDVARITDANGMGTLFKVLAISGQVNSCPLNPSGFQNLS